MKLGDLARELNCELRGSPETEIDGVAGIEEATATQLTFVSNPKYHSKIPSTRAGAIVVSRDAPDTGLPTLLSDNPYLAFARAIPLFYRPPSVTPGIHPTAIIAETAELGENHSIGAHAVIGDGVRVGRNAVVYPNVVIYPHARIGNGFVAHSNAVVREHCRLGDRVILQNGAVIGGDGFGFAPRADGSYFKMVQSGVVILEDDVEVGANACIDRGTVGETRIGKGTKIDNLVQIGHGSTLGSHNILASQTGLAGTTTIGNHVTLAGQVGVAGHLKIGDRVVATAQTGIGRDVAPGSVVSGSPEMDTTLWKRNYILMHRFPELVKSVKRIRKELAELRKSLLGR
jgi:UDP-3-O-[3-hydroxymyristoyl] glucosamine N-acyltransferase